MNFRFLSKGYSRRFLKIIRFIYKPKQNIYAMISNEDLYELEGSRMHFRLSSLFESALLQQTYSFFIFIIAIVSFFESTFPQSPASEASFIKYFSYCIYFIGAFTGPWFPYRIYENSLVKDIPLDRNLIRNKLICTNILVHFLL